ncbi:DUF1800 family protein [Burkholderiaceae bacterium UC74_6]
MEADTTFITPTRAPRPLACPAALTVSSTLAACGGGGGGGGPSPAPGPAPAPPPATPSDGEASRFLSQAAFGGTTDGIATVKAQGYAAWLDAQFALPRTSSHYDWMVAAGYAAVATNANNFNGADNTLWRKLISSPDVLRQRMVLALSEIFVASMNGIPVAWRGFLTAAYVDVLEANAFGSYRALLQAVTLSPAMGVYLNMRGNRKADPKTGRLPDENYAREVMQLFSIGLVQLNLDGTPKLDGSSKPIPTYGQQQITDLAAVFTGWEFDNASNTEPSYAQRPMVNIAARFTTGAKKVLDVSISATADGPAALGVALDTLASHPNVGPFIGRQLIQRFVCSNPSPAYVARIAAVFNDNGAGVRGDLKAVLRAILLDKEARAAPSGNGSGKLREPVMRFLQWARAVGLASPTDLWNVGDLSNPASRLGQSPMRSPSVFNFFRPGYVPPNSQLGTNNVTAPEFQLCNESSVAGYLNFMQGVIANGIGELKPVYDAELAGSVDAAALVDRWSLLLTGSSLSSATRSSLVTAIGTMASTTDANKKNRVQAAILMVMATPEYQVLQ